MVQGRDLPCGRGAALVKQRRISADGRGFGWLGEVLEHGAIDDGGEVSLEASAGLGAGLALGAFAGEVGAGFGVPAGLDHGDGEQGPVELAVAAAGEAVAVGVAAGGGDRCGAGVRGERGRAAEVADVVGLAEDLGRDERTDAGDGEQVLVRAQSREPRRCRSPSP